MTRRSGAVWMMAAGLIIAAIGVVAPSAQDQRSVFSSRVEMVRVDALVTQDKRAVLNLAAADFQVTDNGVPQQVELVSFDQIPLNVVIVLDLSSSLTGERLSQLRAASASLAGVLKKEDQAALVTFTETVTLKSGLTAELDNVRAAIDATSPPDGQRPTALVDALFAGLLTAESDVGRALVVVFSDGVDTGSWLREEAVLDVAKRSDAVVYAVTTLHEGRGDFLKHVVDATGGSLAEVESRGDIGAAFLQILDEFRQRYLISYTPRGVTRDGWHAVTVRVKGRGGLKVKARPGYWGAQ